jgi:alpha-methylacyl-CoA racemase
MASGYWKDERGVNRLDSGAPWYNVYETSDGHWISIGANESRFWRNAVDLLGLSGTELPDQHDQSRWPELKELLAERFRTRTRDEWTTLAEGRQACISPVLSFGEAPNHPHARARDTFVDVQGTVQPAPAPRFSRTPGAIRNPPPLTGADTDVVLGEFGFSTEEIERYREQGAIYGA